MSNIEHPRDWEAVYAGPTLEQERDRFRALAMAAEGRTAALALQLAGAVEALREIATETHAQNSVEGRADDAARMRRLAVQAINRFGGQ